ncbi:MAG: discoidin domain-containing protein, partial [Akkermansiaceae bacterium]|nr:discoidin domain-containing protein [Akkermansiaceae bacterium]
MKYHLMPLVVFALVLSLEASGTVLPVAPLVAKQPWSLPGNEQGALLKEGEETMIPLEVPALGVKEQQIAEGWRGIVSLGLHGTIGNGEGMVTLEAFDPVSGKIFASSTAAVSGKAPQAPWSVISSSAQPGAAALLAFDGDPETSWHSRYSGEKAPAPHWLGLRFSEIQSLEGVRYLPRQGGFTNGVAKSYRIEVQKGGGDWELVHEGTSEQASVANERKALEVKFEKPLGVTAFRFVIESDWSGGGFGTCGEITPLG